MSPRRGAKFDLAEAGRPQPVRQVPPARGGRGRSVGIDLDEPREVDVASGAYRRRMARYRDQMAPEEHEQFVGSLLVDPDAAAGVVVDGRSADAAVAANARRRQLPSYPGSPQQPSEPVQQAPRKLTRRERRALARELRQEHRNYSRERQRTGTLLPGVDDPADRGSGIPFEGDPSASGLTILRGTGSPETDELLLDELSEDDVLEEQRLSPRQARKREKAGRKAAAAAARASGGPGVMVLPPPRGYRVRQSHRRAQRGGYAPLAAPALSSTKQAQILNTAIVAAPTGVAGTIIGRDKLSNTLVAHDPFTAYENGEIGSPAVVALGAISAGKSSLLKTVYVIRPLILRKRRVVVMDKKDRGGEGEYAELARTFGTTPLRFVVGEGGTRLNILDPIVLAGSGVAGQARLLGAIAELANNNVPLDGTHQRPALRAAHRAVLRQAEQEGRDPYLEDLLPQLGQIHPEFADYSPRAKEAIHEAGLGVRELMSQLLSEELAGLFNGPTSPDVRLSDRLTVFDISQLPDEGPAVSMVTAVSNVWLMGMLRNQRGLRTNYVAEEGWHLVGGPGGKVYRRNSKLARGLGLSNIAAIHHLADVPNEDDAIAMIKEAQTVHLYRQDREDDIAACMRTFDLDPGAERTLATLETGHHLLKIGSRPEIHVQHVRSSLERALTNTDEAMVASGKGREM